MMIIYTGYILLSTLLRDLFHDKTLFFALIFTSIPAFYGYNVQGGALEVGKASTKAVVDSSIAILLVNLILTKILLK